MFEIKCSRSKELKAVCEKLPSPQQIRLSSSIEGKENSNQSQGDIDEGKHKLWIVQEIMTALTV